MIEHHPVMSPTLPYIVRLTREPIRVEELRHWCVQHAGQEGSFLEAYGQAGSDGEGSDEFADLGGRWFVATVMGCRVWRFRDYDTAFAFSMRWS